VGDGQPGWKNRNLVIRLEKEEYGGTVSVTECLCSLRLVYPYFAALIAALVRSSDGLDSLKHQQENELCDFYSKHLCLLKMGTEQFRTAACPKPFSPFLLTLSQRRRISWKTTDTEPHTFSLIEGRITNSGDVWTVVYGLQCFRRISSGYDRWRPGEGDGRNTRDSEEVRQKRWRKKLKGNAIKDTHSGTIA
jgi:hypothetical protein